MSNYNVVTRSRPSPLRSAIASLLISSVEWYDFNLYGSAAAIAFPAIFFPNMNPLISVLLSFGTFAVAFITRPLGGIYFGNMGDKIGRKRALSLCLLLMGIGTAGIGLLPPASSIGIIAPVLLIILRILQGISLGGLWGGAVLLAVENAPQGKRGFYGSFAQIGTPIGSLLATSLFLLLTLTLSHVQFLAWGWRVPFLLGGLFIAVTWLVQRQLAETAAFERVKETHHLARLPVFEAFRKYPWVIARVAGAYIIVAGGTYITTVYLLAYGPAIGIPSSTMLSALLISTFLFSFAVAGNAILSDRVGRKRMYIIGVILAALGGFPMFLLVNTKIPVLIILAMTVMALIQSMAFGPLAAFFAESFAPEVRYSGVSVGSQIGSILGGGFAPIIAAALLAATRSWVSIAIYFVAMAAISLISVSLMSETYQRDVRTIEGENAEGVTHVG